jgi:hypothetical protein
MAVQSIRTAVQIRNVTGDHLFVAAGEMAFREMDRVSQFDDATQEIRPSPKALDDAGDLLSPRPGSPKVVSSSCFSGGFPIFDDSDLRGPLCGLSAVSAL